MDLQLISTQSHPVLRVNVLTDPPLDGESFIVLHEYKGKLWSTTMKYDDELERFLTYDHGVDEFVDHDDYGKTIYMQKYPHVILRIGESL